MPIIAITREMGSLGKDVARGLGEALGLPVIYHEVIDHLADRMRVRKSHVIRLLDGSAGLFERLTADKTSLAIYTTDEIYGIAASCTNKGGAIIRGWGATHLLREIPHAVCVRVCAPFELRKARMMERLGSDDAERIAEEIRINDEAHSAIVRRHFGVSPTSRSPRAGDARGARAGELERRPRHPVGRLEHRRDARLRRGRLRRAWRARHRLPHPSGRGTAAALPLRRLT